MNSQKQRIYEIKNIKDQNEIDILKKGNVTGLGIGFKDIKQQSSDELCIKVFVKRKLSTKLLDQADLVPSFIHGIKTDVIEIGEVKAQAFTERMRPVRPGFSIGHLDISAGTFGAIVRDSFSPGHYHILSNNHVLANSNAASIGDDIIQPGIADGGHKRRDVIATLSRYIPIKYNDQQQYNLVDAALAKPISHELIIGAIQNIGLPRGITEAELNMSIIKSGRTTGTTRGNVTAIDASIEVDYGHHGSGYFRHQFLANGMSDGGDSGSLVLGENTEKAVGLLFAGSQQVTVINHIHNVLRALEVELVTA